MPPDDQEPDPAPPPPPPPQPAPVPPKALPPTGREAAQRAAEELLNAAGIRQIILVDDQAMAAAAETAAGLVELIWSKKPSAVKRHLPNTPPDDPDIRIQQVREHVAGLSGFEKPVFLAKLRGERAKLRLTGALPAPDGDEETDDAHQLFSSEIEPLIGGRLRVMLPDEWEREAPGIMKAAFAAAGSGEIPSLPDTLILFDIDLHEAGRGVEAGKDLAVALVRQFSPLPVLCGIVSATIPSREKREEWASGIDIPADGMIFISKRDLGGEPLEFVVELRRVLLAPFAIKFRNISLTAFEAAHKFASERVKEVNVADLVYSVINLSHEEGVTEIDTLRRIYDSGFREEVRRFAASHGDLESIVGQLRAISRLPTTHKLKTKGATWAHQRREMYDQILEVNRLRLPVEVGDVFQFALPDDRRESYVLVAQPCDTIVRSSGLRKLKQGTLAHVLNSRPQHSTFHELRWFQSDGKSAYVDLTDTISVPFEVLDLCAIRSDGVAMLAGTDQEPEGIMAGWKTRRDGLVQAMEADVDFARAAFAAVAGEAAELKIPVVPSHASPLVATVTMVGDKAIRYNCTRVERILMPYAGAILGEFANYLSHDVFAVDLARDLKP